MVLINERHVITVSLAKVYENCIYIDYIPANQDIQINVTLKNSSRYKLFAKLQGVEDETNDDNKVLGQDTIKGYTGATYTTIQKDFENYVFESSSNNTSGKMTKEPIEVYYYYTRMVSGIQEKHIDIKSNEVLKQTEHDGYVGKEYNTTPKEFEGYDIVKTELPKNTEGAMGKEDIYVKYYYYDTALHFLSSISD